MSAQLRIEASVQVDASQATAALGAVTASSAAVAAGMRATTAAAAGTADGLDAVTGASRSVATAAAAAATQGQAATAALTGQRSATAETARAQDQLTASERAGVAAANALASAHKATNEGMLSLRTNNLELLHIGKSLFDEIAAGASPFRALAVEGGRIGEVIAGSGGVKAAFGGLITLLGGPLVVAGLAAVGAVGLVANGFSNAQSAAVKLQRQLDVTGNQAGLTAADIAAMGEKVAAASNTGGNAAIDAVTKLATSGKFTRDEIGQLASAAIGLASRTGETADKVVGAFVKMADGPTGYARQFAASYVGLSAATVEHIRQLEETGQKDQALAVLSKALYDQLGGEAPGKLGFLERAWDAVANAAGRATRAVLDYGRSDTGPAAAAKTLAADIQKQIDAIKGSANYRRFGGDTVSAADEFDYYHGSGQKPQTDNQKLAQLEGQLAIANALTGATDRATAAVAAYNTTQRAGTAASAEIATQWGSIGDHVRKANDEIAKFRADVAAALKANPDDPTALEAQANSAKIEADIRKKYTPDATAAAKAAAEEEKQRAKKLADLTATIALIEGEAAAAARVKEVREEENKLLELRKEYGALFTAAMEDQVRIALEMKALYEGINKTLADNARLLKEEPDFSKLFAAQDAASAAFDRNRKTGVANPQNLGEDVANTEYKRDQQVDFRNGVKYGEGVAQQFQSTAARIGDLIGDAAGHKIGAIAKEALGSIAGRIAANPNDPSSFVSGLQSGFKGFTKDTKDALGDLFTDVFGDKGSDFGQSVGKAFAGASVGQLSGSIVGALGVKTSPLGSELGGALGSIAGPFGSIAGGVIGGILGGLFGKKATSNSDVLSNGIEGTASGSSTIQQTAAQGLGSQVTNGLQQIAAALGGTVGTFSPITIGQRNDNYRVDTTGATIGKYNGQDFGTGSAGEAAAVSYAVSVALQRGGVTGLSPEVQKVIAKYGNDLNTAVSEAVKVKNLQDTIADSLNPYATAFQTFELQAQQRVAVATQYGFDVVQIETINAQQRAKLIQDTLTQATASVQAAIDDLKYGSRATGSIVEQRAALTAEQQRLQGLIAAGDNTQLGALTQIVQQEVDLDKQAYGSTAAYSTSRDDAVALLNTLVQQQSDQITAASAAAQAGTTDTTAATDPTVAALSTLNATGDDQVNLLTTATGYLGTIAGALTVGRGGAVVGASALSQSYARASVA